MLFLLLGLNLLFPTDAALMHLKPENIPLPSISVNSKHRDSFSITEFDLKKNQILTAINVDQTYISKFFDEFKIIYDKQTDSILKKLKMDFWIRPSIAEIKLLHLEMSSLKDTVNFKSMVTYGRVDIPQVYATSETCSHSGRRKYFGVMGPRRRQCTTHYVHRGLNGGEIDLVNNILTDKILAYSNTNFPIELKDEL